MPDSFTNDHTKESNNLTTKHQLSFTPIWATDPTIEDTQLIIDLVNTQAFQRLKNIDQSGTGSYYGKMTFFERYGKYGPMPSFSRYDHSLGVFWLIKYKANSGLAEQAAGLYHDVSHTAFSHVADHLRSILENDMDPMATQKTYQDDIHLDFLKYQNIDSVISPYGLKLGDLEPSKYKSLKGGFAELSADRIQYIVHTAVILDILKKQDASDIVNDVTCNNNIWFFTDQALALKLADSSIILTKEIYTTPSNFVSYQYFSKVLLRAIKLELFTLEDFKYRTDNFILEKLEQTNDPIIQYMLEKLDNINKVFDVVKFNESEIHPQFKSRAVDPNIKTGENEYTKLSNLNPEFAQKFNDLKEWCYTGCGIKYHQEELDTLARLENQFILPDTCNDMNLYAEVIAESNFLHS